MVVRRFAFLTAAVTASEVDESGLLQSHKVSRHGSLQCLPVHIGDIAPVEGEFIDASGESLEVYVGDVADQDGQFCVSAEVAALLERTRGKAKAQSTNLDEAIKKKKKKPLRRGVMSDERIEKLFSLTSIGPFPLVKRDDLSVNQTADGFTVTNTDSDVTMKGKLASTINLDGAGADYWLGAREVDWAYQPSDVSSEEAIRGSFGLYGGFVFNEAVYEIGGSETTPEQTEMTMHFSWPFQMTEKDWVKCKNPSPVTIQPMMDAGAQEYCWEVDHDYCERGCFIYKTDKGYQGFYVKDFALTSIGPFPLEDITSSESVTVRRKTWTSGDFKGRISTADRKLTAMGRSFWFNAAEVSWAYQGEDFESATNSFQQYGGFLLRRDDGTENSWKTPAMVLQIGDENSTSTELTLEFGNPFEISRKEWRRCQNPAPVTIDPMLAAGAEQYCWEQHWERCPRGCFFYQTRNGYQAFAVQNFAMASLGPFNLLAHVNDTISSSNLNISGDSWTLDGHSGRLSAEATIDHWGGWVGSEQVQWMYPADEADDSAGSFEKTGGFLVRHDQGKSIMEIMPRNSVDPIVISFDDPMHITEAQFEAGCGGNPAPITLPTLLSIGTEQYCWVVPGAEDWCGSHGCFIYKTRTGYQSFAVHP